MKTTWVIGLCWRCEARYVPVLWLGPVQSMQQGDAPFHCCEPCILRLEQLVQAHHASRGIAAA